MTRTCLAGLVLLIGGCGTGRGPTAGPGVAEIPPVGEALQMLAGQLQPAGPTRVAVFPFVERAGPQGTLGSYLADKFMLQYMQWEHVELVERAALDTVVREQRLAVSGAISDETAASIGNLLGAQAVIVGTITRDGGGIELIARLLSTDGGAVLRMAEVAFTTRSLPAGVRGQTAVANAAPPADTATSRPPARGASGAPGAPATPGSPAAPASPASPSPPAAPIPPVTPTASSPSVTTGSPSAAPRPKPAGGSCATGPIPGERLAALLNGLDGKSFADQRSAVLAQFLRDNSGGVTAAMLQQLWQRFSFQDQRLTVLMTLRPRLCPMTTNQVGRLLAGYPFSDDRLAVLAILKERITDPANRFELLEHFTFDDDQRQARGLLE